MEETQAETDSAYRIGISRSITKDFVGMLGPSDLETIAKIALKEEVSGFIPNDEDALNALERIKECLTFMRELIAEKNKSDLEEKNSNHENWGLEELYSFEKSMEEENEDSGSELYSTNPKFILRSYEGSLNLYNEMLDMLIRQCQNLYDADEKERPVVCLNRLLKIRGLVFILKIIEWDREGKIRKISKNSIEKIRTDMRFSVLTMGVVDGKHYVDINLNL